MELRESEQLTLFCETGILVPATVTDPERVDAPALADTENVAEPDPVNEGPEVGVIHAEFDWEDHAQPPGAVTWTEKVPPGAGMAEGGPPTA